MTLLEKVIEMQNSGMQEPEIIKRLMNQGISPREVNDSLNQARIKQAVSQPEINEVQGMEQSIMQPEEQPALDNQNYYQDQANQQYAPQYEYAQQQPALDTETITEIAQQVVSEKFAEFHKKTGDLASFKFQVQEKITEIDERVRRIESMLDKIQSAIVGKFGEVAENINFMHKDMENLHSTMSKLMNPLVDNYHELKKIAKK